MKLGFWIVFIFQKWTMGMEGKTSHSPTVKPVQIVLWKQLSDFHLLFHIHRCKANAHWNLYANLSVQTHLQVCNCLPKSFSLLHIIPCFFKHEFTTGKSHISNYQSFLSKHKLRNPVELVLHFSISDAQLGHRCSLLFIKGGGAEVTLSIKPDTLHYWN